MNEILNELRRIGARLDALEYRDNNEYRETYQPTQHRPALLPTPPMRPPLLPTPRVEPVQRPPLLPTPQEPYPYRTAVLSRPFDRTYHAPANTPSYPPRQPVVHTTHPDTETQELQKNLFNTVRLTYQTQQWENLPTNIDKKINLLLENIHLPLEDESLKNKFNLISNNLKTEILVTCHDHITEKIHNLRTNRSKLNNYKTREAAYSAKQALIRAHKRIPHHKIDQWIESELKLPIHVKQPEQIIPQPPSIPETHLPSTSMAERNTRTPAIKRPAPESSPEPSPFETRNRFATLTNQDSSDEDFPALTTNNDKKKKKITESIKMNKNNNRTQRHSSIADSMIELLDDAIENGPRNLPMEGLTESPRLNNNTQTPENNTETMSQIRLVLDTTLLTPLDPMATAGETSQGAETAQETTQITDSQNIIEIGENSPINTISAMLETSDEAQQLTGNSLRNQGEGSQRTGPMFTIGEDLNITFEDEARDIIINNSQSRARVTEYPAPSPGLKNNWKFEPGTGAEVVILADSNFRLSKTLPDNYEIHVYPGAKLTHATAMLKKLQSANSRKYTNLKAIVLSIGINNRGFQRDTLQSENNKLMKAAEALPWRVFSMGVSVPNTLPREEQELMDHLNKHTLARRGGNFIPPLPGNKTKVSPSDSMGIHFDQVTQNEVDLHLKNFLGKTWGGSKKIPPTL